MAKAYTKEFILDVFLDRYLSLDEEKFASLEKMANDFYDKVGKEEFRKYGNISAERIKEYTRE